MRTEAEAAQAAERSERRVGELSKALADAAGDAQAARQALLQSDDQAAPNKVSSSVCGALPNMGNCTSYITVCAPLWQAEASHSSSTSASSTKQRLCRDVASIKQDLDILRFAGEPIKYGPDAFCPLLPVFAVLFSSASSPGP